MILEQILVTDMLVFCYIVADEESREAAVIDPGGEVEKIFRFLKSHRLDVRWVINTHGHYDHTDGDEEMLKRTSACLVLHEKDARMLDPNLLSWVKNEPGRLSLVQDGDSLPIGKLSLKVLATPGHTPGGICLLVEQNLFTGDTLFSEGVGRTDFPGGSERELLKSIKEKILSLPDDTRVFPGHDYGPTPTSSVKEQKRFF